LRKANEAGAAVSLEPAVPARLMRRNLGSPGFLIISGRQAERGGKRELVGRQSGFTAKEAL
jgi:hypothetical protein